MVALTKLLFAVRFSYGAWVTISDLRGLKFQAQSFLFVLLLSGFAARSCTTRTVT